MAYRYEGTSNIGLVDALEDAGFFRSPRIRAAFLSLPRGVFIPASKAELAFVDRPLRLDDHNFNVSAPHMYAVCLQNLEIQPGHSFLDVGSGCGYMTALGAYLSSPGGTTVGVDINSAALDLAHEAMVVLKGRGHELSNISFENRNIFLPDLQERKFDRIHVGACCPQRMKHHLYDMLKPGGVIVLPIGNHLIKATKDIGGFTRETPLMEVRYGELELPTPEEIEVHSAQMALQIRRPSRAYEEPQEFSKMFNNPFLADITFQVGGRQIFAHRAILASRSEYFASFFRSGMKDSANKAVVVTAFSATVFTEMLRCLYTGSCAPLPFDQAIELLSASEYYSISVAKQWAEYYLSQSLVAENASIIFEAAHTYSSHRLKTLAFEFIIANYRQVSHTETFDRMNKECYKEILLEAVNRLPDEAKILSSSPPKS